MLAFGQVLDLVLVIYGVFGKFENILTCQGVDFEEFHSISALTWFDSPQFVCLLSVDV